MLPASRLRAVTAATVPVFLVLHTGTRYECWQVHDERCGMNDLRFLELLRSFTPEAC